MTKWVLWSGGHDSTLVLYSLLQESSWTEPVYAVSINHPNLTDTQYKMEVKARNKMKKIFKKRGFHLIHRTITIKTPLNSKQCDEGLPQPIWWIALMSQYLDDGDELHMGYIAGDDYWFVRQETELVFHNICKVMGKKCKIKYPLYAHQKVDILKELKKVKIKDCWTCDQPINGRPCNTCKPCKSLKVAKYLLLESDHKK
jgi:7-cyano-7-deazaguanine synthase in queuosine biosynthesis